MEYLLGLTEAMPVDERGRLVERLNIAAGGLPDEQLATVVTQVEALSMPRQSKRWGGRPPAALMCQGGGC